MFVMQLQNGHSLMASCSSLTLVHKLKQKKEKPSQQLYIARLRSALCQQPPVLFSSGREKQSGGNKNHGVINNHRGEARERTECVFVGQRQSRN